MIRELFILWVCSLKVYGTNHCFFPPRSRTFLCTDFWRTVQNGQLKAFSTKRQNLTEYATLQAILCTRTSNPIRSETDIQKHSLLPSITKIRPVLWLLLALTELSLLLIRGLLLLLILLISHLLLLIRRVLL